MIGYVLVSSGEKLPGPVAGWPKADTQRRNLRALAAALKKNEDIKIEFLGDYARSASGLRSFPELFWVLSRCRDQAQGRVVIDDFRRLFRVCRQDRRSSLLQELQECGHYLSDVRTGRRVSEISEAMKFELLHHPTGEPFRVPGVSRVSAPSAARQTQTQKARAASGVARAAEADARAMSIWSIREELVAQQGHATYAEIAAEATRRGVRTERGGIWRATNIGRMLERAQGLQPEEQEKEEDLSA